MVDCGHQQEQHRRNTRRLSWALGVILLFMVVEVVGGFISGSLALLADATHMLTDALALALAVSAQFFSARPADARLHFGYRRAQVLAAFVNGILLTFLLCWIIFEAVHRFFQPIEVQAGLMFTVAMLGLAANAVAFAMLHRPHERDLNMRGAILHVIGDLLGSVAAIVAAIVIYFSGWVRIDPILSIFVAFLIGVSALRLVKETGFILLEGAPKDIKVDELEKGLLNASPVIKDVHDIQISQITPDQPRLTLHVCVDNADDAHAALEKAKEYLESRYHIHHSTIQVEVGECPDKLFSEEVRNSKAAENAAGVSRVSGSTSPAFSASD